MQVRGATGRIAGSPRTTFKADARIADFDAAEVAVQGQLAGPLADSLSIVNASPLSQMTQQALARATGTGSADVQLKLRLPLAKLENSQVQGAVNLPGNDVQITPGSPMLARARGAVHFSENGFQIMQVQARTLGGDVRLEGGTVAGSRDVVVRAQGTATIEALRQASELGYASRVARVATGAANYALTLTLRGSVPEVLVTSDLQGVALGLPAPLNKPAESVLPLRYESMLTREALAAPEGSPLRKQEQLRVELGRAAAFQFLLDHSSAQPRALRGGVALGLAAGESAPAPPQGVVANVNVPILDVDAWQDAVQTIAAGDVPSTVTAAVAPGAAASGPRSGADSFLPTNLAIRARELRVEGRSLHNVVIGGSRDGLTWRANVDADELGGYVEYRQPANTGSGRLYARLARLKLAASGGSDVEALLEEQVNSIPALDVVVDDFELKGRKLGRLEIDAVNRGAGTVVREGGIREWRLNRLALTTPEATFTASGNWAAIGARPVAPGGPRQEAVAGEKRRTAMKFQLEVRESGALLARFGMKDVVRGGKGALRGELAWTGSPLGFDYPTLSGRFHVDVQAGQFLKAEPGLAKLLGVLSLQSLPRRLALDFRDVFSEGFSFDFVRGDVSVDQGIASTNNLQMKGVNAAVLMDGKADIARETQDLKVVVVPEINAGTASLVATVINPAIGLGSFLAQVFLREPLMRAATQEFHVDGTWSEPRVTRVPRASAAGGSSGEADPRR